MITYCEDLIIKIENRISAYLKIHPDKEHSLEIETMKEFIHFLETNSIDSNENIKNELINISNSNDIKNELKKFINSKFGTSITKKDINPKGYYVGNGYIGYLENGNKILFSTEKEYLDYIKNL